MSKVNSKETKVKLKLCKEISNDYAREKGGEVELIAGANNIIFDV